MKKVLRLTGWALEGPSGLVPDTYHPSKSRAWDMGANTVLRVSGPLHWRGRWDEPPPDSLLAMHGFKLVRVKVVKEK
jgi:hypothetical protein